MTHYLLEQETIRPDVQLVRLRGEITAANAALLREEALNLVAEGMKIVVFDFSAVTEIDSAGIGAFLALAKQTAAGKSEVRIFGANSLIHKTLELAHLTRYVPVFPDIDAALSPAASGHRN